MFADEPSSIPALSRRDALRLGLGIGIGAMLTPALAAEAAEALRDGVLGLGQQQKALITRAIPSSGEKLPVIGIGTARRYDVPAGSDMTPLLETLKAFPKLGGKVVDTAPAYGRAEVVTGELVKQAGIRDQLFLATKVSVRGTDTAPGVAQMEESFKRLYTDRIDLMQVHNLGGTEALLPVLRDMKAAKRIRYIGVTTSNEQQYPTLISIMEKEPLDFIQVDYAADNREVAQRILPMARDKGIGVMVNLPFGRSRVFANVLSTPVPEWAGEFDATTWAQVFLKYIVANPAVTCVIPGTAQLKYVNDNTSAARGKLPTAAHLARIEQLVQRAM